MIPCPEPGCDAVAEVETVGVATFTVWEQIASAGLVWAEPEPGHAETLELVEVRCTAGHRSRGPAEMLDGRR